MAMRRVAEAEARERLWWLDPAPPMKYTGCDAGGWADSIWVLPAMFERDDLAADLTYDAVLKEDLASGRETPHLVNGVNMTEDATLTGVPLGYVTTPGPPWKRLRWAELAAREGFELGAGMAHPPSSLWFPTRSWAVRITPPPEGSLDELSLDALIRLLVQHTRAESLRDCSAFFCPAAIYRGHEEITIYVGGLSDVPELTVERDSSPSNLWPADRSWFIYTDWDLMATRVSGSRELIAAIETDHEIETLRWQRSTAT